MIVTSPQSVDRLSLHPLLGAAGAGKTSLIHACASALDLEVYCITLATEGLTDAILLKAMTLIPPGGVVVMEDVDVAIPKSSNEGLNRDDAPARKEEENRKKGDRGSSGGHITLSGKPRLLVSISQLKSLSWHRNSQDC